jgi:hypothetical protein
MFASLVGAGAGQYMESFLPDHLAAAEPGYCLVLFQTAAAALQDVAGTHAAEAQDARAAQEDRRRQSTAATEKAEAEANMAEADATSAMAHEMAPANYVGAFQSIRGAVWREAGATDGAWADMPFDATRGHKPAATTTAAGDAQASAAALVANLVLDSGLGLQDFRHVT